MEDQSGGGRPDLDQIAELRARAEAGDRNAGGRLGELLARQGDRVGALRVWAQAYGDVSSTTRQLAELLTEQDNLEGAVQAWQFSDVVRQNPAGLHQEHLSTLSPEDYLEETSDDPEDWAYLEAERLASLRADWGDGRNRYIARWAEHELPGSSCRSSTCSPRPLEQAKALLVLELRRVLTQWAARGGDPVRYHQAVETLENASGPVTIDLPGHVFTLTEARKREQ
jgi:hypothetical protein